MSVGIRTRKCRSLDKIQIKSNTKGDSQHKIRRINSIQITEIFDLIKKTDLILECHNLSSDLNIFIE